MAKNFELDNGIFNWSTLRSLMPEDIKACFGEDGFYGYGFIIRPAQEYRIDGMLVYEFWYLLNAQNEPRRKLIAWAKDYTAGIEMVSDEIGTAFMEGVYYGMTFGKRPAPITTFPRRR